MDRDTPEKNIFGIFEKPKKQRVKENKGTG